MVYRAFTSVRFPLSGPKVEMYAVAPAPNRVPKVPVSMASVKPRLKAKGPKRPRTRLLAVTLAENQMSAIWASECQSANNSGRTPQGTIIPKGRLLCPQALRHPLDTPSFDTGKGLEAVGPSL